MIKKNIYLIITIILCFIALACFYNIHGKKEATKKNVVVWTLQMGNFAEYMNGVISKYEQQHPDIKIIWIDVPFSEGEKRTLASILSNNPPDLVNLNPDFSAILAQKGALEYIDEKKLSEFNQDIVDSLKYNGNLFAVPWYATSAITIYNKSLLKKSGITTFSVFSTNLTLISSLSFISNWILLRFKT